MSSNTDTPINQASMDREPPATGDSSTTKNSGSVFMVSQPVKGGVMLVHQGDISQYGFFRVRMKTRFPSVQRDPAWQVEGQDNGPIKCAEACSGGPRRDGLKHHGKEFLC